MKQVLQVIAMLGLAAALGGRALAQDHFRCYPVASPTTLATAATLQDQFDAAMGTVENITTLTSMRFCNPVEKIVNGVISPNFNPTHHLLMYQINPQTPVTRTVTVRNQFGRDRTDDLPSSMPTASLGEPPKTDARSASSMAS